MRNTTCIVDVLARTAATFAACGLPMVVKLQGDPDHVVTCALHKRGHD
jgi:hypothetical protein